MSKALFWVGRAFAAATITALLFGCATGGQSVCFAEEFEQAHKDQSAIFILFDIAVKVNEDYSYEARVHKSAKILKEDARVLGEFQIPYDSSRETVKDIKSFTITSDGKKHSYSRIQDTKAYENFGMYSDARVKIITLPEVNIGSILEHSYNIISKRSPVKGAWWDSFGFSFSTPTKEVRCSITYPKKMKMQYREINLAYKPTITDSGSHITYSWHLYDMYDKKLNETYIPYTEDIFKNMVEFSTIKDWDEVAKWYYAAVQKNLLITPEIDKAAKTACENKSAITDKTRAILEYLQDNFRYVSMSFGDNALEPHPTIEVFKNKYGDCKDLSVLCMAMLKAVGIDSNIVLFSTEDEIVEPQNDPPLPDMFSHVLLLVKNPVNGDFYADPLLKGFDIGQFPPAYQAGYCFVIMENNGKFTRMPVFDEKADYTLENAVIEIKADGSAVIERSSTWDMSWSLKIKDIFKSMNDKEKEEFFQSLETNIAYGGKVYEHKIEGLDKRYGLINTYVKYHRPNMFPLTDDMIIIDMGGGERGELFTENERTVDIFYHSNSLSEEATTYKVPDGFKVSHLPKDLSLDIGFLRIMKKYKIRGKEIIVNTTTTTKRITLPKSDFAKVKEFYNQLPAKTKQKIILKKTKPFLRQVKELWARMLR
jgi:hypothetical protein